jgi:2-iminobutanoate/2-iminopropanoate deaminase
VKVQTKNAPTPKAPYAQGIKANGFLFVTGQVSRDPVSGDFVDGPFDDQFRRSIRNLEAILVAGGSSLGQVTMLTIYMLSHDDLDTMNRVLGGSTTPARRRSAWASGKCRVMIDAIAVAS